MVEMKSTSNKNRIFRVKKELQQIIDIIYKKSSTKGTTVSEYCTRFFTKKISDFVRITRWFNGQLRRRCCPLHSSLPCQWSLQLLIHCANPNRNIENHEEKNKVII